MKHNQKYIVPFKGLKDGKHVLGIEVGRELFERFDSTDTGNARLQVEMELVKKPTHMEIEMRVSGKIEVVCDRCLEYYYQDIFNTGKLFVRCGETHEEVNEELLVLSHDETELDISQFVYDLAMLGLPMKRQHPLDENRKSLCDPAMVKILEELKGKGESAQQDPRWDKLKDLHH